jgi:hypothetical protein
MANYHVCMTTMEVQTSGQAASYAEAMRIVRACEGVKLTPGEADLLRETCDALFFCENDSEQLLERSRTLVNELVETGRWIEAGDWQSESAPALLAAVEGCGIAD